MKLIKLRSLSDLYFFASPNPRTSNDIQYHLKKSDNLLLYLHALNIKLIKLLPWLLRSKKFGMFLVVFSFTCPV